MVVKPKYFNMNFNVNFSVLLNKSYIVHPLLEMTETLIVSRCTVQLWKLQMCVWRIS